MDKQQQHKLLWVILAIFILLTTLHSLIVPITQGEDELAHYRYISFIAQNGRLPVNYDEREQAWYRADWPPLYHLLIGWIVSPLDTSRPHLKDVGESPRRRLVGKIFYPRLIIYTEDANWPWQDGILAWHIGRFISILFSAGALIFTYLTFLEMGQKYTPALALMTTALLAFTPRYIFSSSMLGDDSLMILLSAIFIWLLLRALRGYDSWLVYVGLGLLLGLSIATKYSTGLLPFVIVPVAMWRAKDAGWLWIQWVGRVAVSWLAVIVGSGWWFGWIAYYFNTIKDDGLFFGLLSPLLNSGPDVSMRRIFAFFSFSQFTGQERPASIESGSFWQWLSYLFQTFWGVPVLEHAPLFPYPYLLMLWFSVMAVVGLYQLLKNGDVKEGRIVKTLAFIVILLLPFPVLRFFLTHNILETGQGRHILYPAAQAIPILLLLGWSQSARLKALTLFAPLFLLAWSIFQLSYMVLIYPAPLPVTTFNPSSIPQPLEYNFNSEIQMLGYELTPTPENLSLTLFWRSLKQTQENYRVRVQLVDLDGQPHLTWLSHPVNGLYPTRAWDKGDVIRDTIPLPVSTLPPDVYNIQVSLLREAEDISLTDQPLTVTQFELQPQLPLNGSTLGKFTYRLWFDTSPTRYRQTLSLSWDGADNNPEWVLVGSDNIPRTPAATGDKMAVFMVGADWLDGRYRLQLNGGLQAETELTVANDFRLFSLPAGVEAQADYIPVEATFAGLQGQPQLKLLGYSLPTRHVEPGGGLPLTLYWQSIAPVLGDYVMFDVLLDENQQSYGGYDRLPREYYSTILWAENEVVEDGFAVPVSPEAPPGIYYLHIGFYSLASGSPVSLPLIQDGQPGDTTSVALIPIKVGGSPSGTTAINPAPQTVLNQSFNGQVTLLGYDMITNSEYIKLVLYWQVETELQTDYTTFLHLRDANNMPVAQKDRPPANGRYPSSLWDVGEVIIDEIKLPVGDVSPGQYRPVVGLYDAVTGMRLPVAGLPENEVGLESVTLP